MFNAKIFFIIFSRNSTRNWPIYSTSPLRSPPHPSLKILLRTNNFYLHSRLHGMWLKYDWNESMTSICVMTSLLLRFLLINIHYFNHFSRREDVQHTSQCVYLIFSICLFVLVCSNRENSSSFTHRFSINIFYFDWNRPKSEWVMITRSTTGQRSRFTTFLI